ncbi:MAG: hypothetical protein COA50_02030 [Flavobacteriaceae bacterium]|nr:MAG: hypothetical protein COA50_02030 [Flavobacteriaceae bacterium]
MLPCLNKRIFGIECPGCGLQRSMAFLLKGDFLEAFKMYPAIYTLILLFSFLMINNFVKIKHANKIIIGLSISSVVLILTNYILKFI